MAIKTKTSQPKLRKLEWGPLDVHPACEDAKEILYYTHEAASSLLDSYNQVRLARNPRRGTSTTQEQDLLRAMLVMSAAGLDGMTKQLIRNTLPSLIDTHESVRKGLETFVARRLKGCTDSTTGAIDTKFMARLLSAKSHQAQAIEDYIQDLTGGSLQSADELIRSANALYLPEHERKVIVAAKDDLNKAFAIRNMVVHELDMKSDGKKARGRRLRNERKIDDMKSHVEKLLDIGVMFICGVSERLKNQISL